MGATWLLLLSACAAANADFDGFDAETGSGEGGTTITPPTTGEDGPEPTTVGPGDSGSASCEEPPAGVEVVVQPMGVVPKWLCGVRHEGQGVLINNGASYSLQLDPAGGTCGPEPGIPMSFFPAGPSIPIGAPVCVDYELSYSDGCELEHAIFLTAGEELLFMASTLPESPRGDIVGISDEPDGDVCDCEIDGASCCDVRLEVGLRKLQFQFSGGLEPIVLSQGDRHTLMRDGSTYEISNEQSRVTAQCDDPYQFDWFIRRTTGQ